jgi:hypothetical protein
MKLGRPAPEVHEGGVEAPPIESVKEVDAGASAAEIHMQDINELMWPGQVMGGGMAPNEHRLRAVPGIFDLADADDGALRSELQLNVASIADYLSADQGPPVDGAGAADAGTAAPMEPWDLTFVDSDCDSDCELLPDNILGSTADGGLTDAHAAALHCAQLELDDNTEGVKDTESQVPLDVDEVQRLLQALRYRGGDFEADQWSEGEGGNIPPLDEQVAHDHVVDDVNVDGMHEEPLWETQGNTACLLKQLQVVHLLTQYRERHKLTSRAFIDLLAILQLLLPANCLPRSEYSFQKASRSVLTQTLGGTGFQRLHMCSDPECPHLYENKEDRSCPRCQKPRYQTLQNGREKAVREVRYMGLEQGVRLLLMSRSVSQALQNFDLEGMLDSVYSVYSSVLSEDIAKWHIPGYMGMAPDQQRAVKSRFFSTGQVCSDAEWELYCQQVQAGERKRSVLLMVEGGCDAFQPFKRRVWSTWLMGYRLTCVNWYDGRASDYEIVTAISEGASEGKAAQVVAALDAQQLLQLAPLSATERVDDLSGEASRTAPLASRLCLSIQLLDV